MKQSKLLFILSLLCFSHLGYGQCPTEDIILDTQAAIDNFSTDYPGYTTIVGSFDQSKLLDILHYKVISTSEE